MAKTIKFPMISLLISRLFQLHVAVIWCDTGLGIRSQNVGFMEQKTLQTLKVSLSVKYHFVCSQFTSFTGRKEQRDNNLVSLKSSRGAQTGQSLLQSAYLYSIAAPPLHKRPALKIGSAGAQASPYQLSVQSFIAWLSDAGTVVTMVIHQRHFWSLH